TSRLNGMHPVCDARYDSSFSDKIERRGCFSNTRIAVLESIRQWLQDPSGPRIHWISGMAGTGKTTIAYSVCKELEQNGRLGASYFCSRASPGSQDVGRILPTISCQLAQTYYPFQSALCRILGDEPSISQRNISVQFECLIKSPILEVKNMLPDGLVVVIDGLDECVDSRTTRALLELLIEHTGVLPLRLFLTSRPELNISDLITSHCYQTPSVLHLHDVQAEVVKADIKTYLSVALAKFNLSGEQILKLAERSGVLFIYAVTLARYLIGGSPGSSTSSRLSIVLDGDSKPTGKQNRGVDRLYKAILDQVFGDEALEEGELKLIQDVLWTVVCAKEPVTKATLAVFLEADNDRICAALQPLQSVLHISESKNVVSTFHSSFPEFLLQSELAGSLRCDYGTHNWHLATKCFVVMKKQLRFNICNLSSSHKYDNDVQDLSRRVKGAISSELCYACRHWAEHLRLSPSCNQLISYLSEFLKTQLLFWMEVLNFRKSVGKGSRALIMALKWLPSNGGSPEISELHESLRDAYVFTTTFAGNPVCRSTPHLYLSVLPLIPARNRVRDIYKAQLKGIPWVKGSTLSRREGAALVTWEASCGVTAVAYSSDSMRVAYGCRDGSICVWDTYYGTRVDGRFKGHDKLVSSLAFSPNGARLISSSRDCTIRIWNAETGVALDCFRDDTQAVNSVTFSPDGTRIASAGDDCTVWLRDSNSGAVFAGPFQGHTLGVTSIAFSPDGTWLASGSYDCTIRVWATTPDGAAPVNPFKGHNSGILSVAFSPDGERIASGSLDRTIRIWSSSTGTPLISPFKGHTDSVSAVAFSSDGTRVISGSWDCTVRVWDTIHSVQVAGPFNGHTQGVTSLALSPDGRSIVSGSWDGFIHFWDAHANVTGGVEDLGHTKAVTCVKFSPDGSSLISSSADSSICIWDAYTGDLNTRPNTAHKGNVNSVAFSPDGRFFLSGSDDCTACLWDAENNTTIVRLTGHEAGVTSVAFSPGGTGVATGSHDNTLGIWDGHSSQMTNQLKGHTRGITSLAFSPDGRRIISGSWDNTIRLWDVNTGVTIAQSFDSHNGTRDGHRDVITSVAFSSDGTRIASGSYDETVQVWSVSDNSPLLTKLFECYANAVISVAFSPDSTRLVAGSRDGTIRMWDAQRGILITDRFNGHTDAVNSIAFAPDGRRMVSGSSDHTIRIWEVSGDHSSQERWIMSPEGWLLDPARRPVLWVPADMP
ncbi:hypothetical protein FRC11_006765, partial [Ceratobasidium sp. 423]